MEQRQLVVAVATYRRPLDIARCLQSIRDERLRYLAGHDGYDISILVVDNDADGGAREIVAAHGGPEVTYLVEPHPGISAARNRALAAAAAADLLIFVDDDEEIVPGWLEHMLRTQERWRPAAVAGRVVSHYPGEPEPWFEAGGFFRRRSLPTGTRIDVAATNNLLLDLAVIRELGLSFDEYYGLTGGGDHHFTRRLARLGHTLVWCNEAVVIDHVPANRLTREWVLARARRSGSVEVIVDLRLAATRAARMRSRARSAARGAYRLLAGAVAAGIGRVSGSLRYQAKGAKAINRGRGMLIGAAGFIVAEYERAAIGTRPIRVLTSFREPRATTNPYITQLARALDQAPGVELLRFSWRTAVAGSYDVVHVHWPEVLLRSSSRFKRYGRTLVFAGLLARWRISGTPVVRTLHNATPHEQLSPLQRLLLRQLDALTVRVIALNAADAGREATALIPHGHYEDVFAAASVPAAEAGRVAFVGLIRSYKNVPALVTAFTDVFDSDARLKVAGLPDDERLARAIRRAAADDDRICLELRFLDQHELATEIGRAQLVALPYAQMHNSGAALLALSLGRPVLVPDNEINRLLAAEVGEAWVQRYVGDVTAQDLVRALSATKSLPHAARPDLSARSWEAVGEAHAAVYRAARAARGRSGRTASASRAARG